MTHGMTPGLAILLILVVAGVTFGHVAWFIAALVVLGVSTLVGD